MTSMFDCIQRAIDAKELDPERGRAAQDHFTQLVARYETVMPRHQAEAAAAADLKEATRRAVRSRYHAVVNQLQAMRRIKAVIDAADDPAYAIKRMIEYSEGTNYAGESIRSLAEAYHSSIAAGLREVLERHGLNWRGVGRNQMMLGDLMEELHGKPSGSESAARLAEAVRHQQKRMRQLFNAHGGDIGELADYGIPHAHSADQLISKGFDSWANAIELRLDWDKINDLGTGRPFGNGSGGVPPRADTERFLREIYDGITTGGWNKRDPRMSTGGAALYSQRADHRVLHFKSGGDWLAYNKEFGAADPFSAMMNGLFGLANDVAMMRVLGPNPRAGLEFAIQSALKRAADLRDHAMAARVRSEAYWAKTMMAHQDGTANIPVNLFWARFFSNVRAFQVSANLGSAVLSSTSDMVTIADAALHMGMSPASVASRTAELIASPASRAEAAQMGYIASSLADAGAGTARFHGELIGTGITQQMATATLKTSGLTFITDMRRLAFQTEFSAYMARNGDQAFDAIDPPLRAVLERRGITATDWDHLRNPEYRFRPEDGAEFISPIYWLQHQKVLPDIEAEGLAMRMQAITQEHMEIAIPSVSLEGRARTLGNTQPGTFQGELLRSTMQYKSFALSLMISRYRRFQTKSTIGSKLAYVGAIGGLLTLTGAMTIQLKEIRRGNDPRPMDTAKFWLAALLQGGGLGIFGDFFAAEQNRMGGGIGETIAGPSIGLGGNLLGALVSEPITRMAEGKDYNLGRSVTQLMRQNTPVLSSHWMISGVYNRAIMDNVQAFLDSEAPGQWLRQDRQRERDYGNKSLWDRGTPLPNRMPDLSNIAGGQ